MKKTSITLRDILKMTLAQAIVAVAVYFFLMPSHTSISSVAGLAIVLQNFIPLRVSQITMIINVLLLIMGFIFCGNEFGGKTVYTSILLPVFLAVLEFLFPDYTSFTGDDVLDVVCYLFVVSVGMSILFNMNASSGGLDIVAKIMSKYLRMDVGRAVTICGMVVSLSSILAYDGRTVVLSVLGSYFNGIIVDNFIFDHNLKRKVCILSPKEEEIRRFIIDNLHSGATIYEAIGVYRMQKHNEIIVVVSKSEYQKLMAFIEEVDPDAFITVYKVSEMRYRSKSLEERQF